MYAASYGLPADAFEQLIRYGADVNYVNRYGCTVVFLYCQFNKKLSEAVLKTIFRAGFDMTLLPQEEFYRII